MNKLLFCLLSVGLSSGFLATNSYSGPISNQAKEFGATQCLKEIQSLDKFLNKKSNDNGAWSSASKKDPANRLYTSLNVKKFSDGTWGYANITVVPGLDNNCDAILTQLITYPKKSCDMVRETVFKKYKYYGVLAGKALYKRGSTKLVLEELTGSCIAMRVEVLYPSPK